MSTESARPRVLVLLAARNGAAWIERQISSVLTQRDVDVQISVRDDASTDATRSIVSELSAHDPRIRLLADHVATGSAGANFFRLIAEATTDGIDLVAFCDQDDEWFADKLARAAFRLADSKADGYSAAVLARWPDGREKRLGQNGNQRSADYLFEGAGQGCTFVMTRRLFQVVRTALAQAPDLAAAIHYHDWTTYALARSSGMSWCVDPVPVMTYHQHAANDTGARMSMSGISRRVAQIRSGWYREQVSAMAAFVMRSNPRDGAALRWQALEARRGVGGILMRLGFVLRHGRRRFSDRLIQAVAVLGGHL